MAIPPEDFPSNPNIEVDRESIAIVDRIRSGSITVEAAIEELKDQSTLGVLWAGELSIEQAYQATDPGHAVYHLEYAQRLFTAVENETSYRQIALLPTRVRAQIQSAYLPIHASIVFEKSLPNQDLAKRIYNRTVSVGRFLVQSYADSHIGSGKVRGQIFGLASEIATVAMLERYATKEDGIGSNTFFAVPTTVSDDRKLADKLGVIHGWDASVLTQQPGQEPVVSYRLQVKSFKGKAASKQKYGEEIIVFYVVNDLGITLLEPHVALNIINDCFVELEMPESAEEAKQVLDQREKAMLEKLGLA